MMCPLELTTTTREGVLCRSGENVNQPTPAEQSHISSSCNAWATKPAISTTKSHLRL